MTTKVQITGGHVWQFIDARLADTGIEPHAGVDVPAVVAELNTRLHLTGDHTVPVQPDGCHGEQ